MKKIQMVDLGSQYARLKPAIDEAIQRVLNSTQFIKGPEVTAFEQELAAYCGCPHVVACANGTDALQIALMALGLSPGDEVILPAFTYVATAEVVALLGLTPVLADVDPQHFNLNPATLPDLITPKTRAIVPVHLFGQAAPMAEIMEIAEKHQLFVVEDTAQAIGAVYTFPDGRRQMAGTIGHIGTTSFFPSKNLGCYGDGGALFTNDESLAQKIRMIANHGQQKQYYHQIVGVNSRLDALQAAILRVKLRELPTFTQSRQAVAGEYDRQLAGLPGLQLPVRVPYSTHIFHQYTIQVSGRNIRDELKRYLTARDIPSMIYYPMPLHHQQAYENSYYPEGSLPVSEQLCEKVLSLPMHTEMEEEQQAYIIQALQSFFSDFDS